MKTLLVTILILTFSNTFGQIVYDKDVQNQYFRLYKKLPRGLQIEFDKKSKDPSNEDELAIFTEYKCDTLNNIEQKETSLSQIILIDPKTNRPVKSNPKTEKYPMLFCRGTIQNDTLGIQISGLFLDQAIIHFINKDRITIFYFEHYKNDSLLKENINDSLTNNINVSTKILRFVLSDSAYKVGNTIYGSAEIITNNYFLKDTWEDNHFYKLRWRLKYYFKCRVTKNGA